MKQTSKEEIIQNLIDAFNKAIKDADHVNENEMKRNAVSLVETRIDINFLTTYSQNYTVYFVHLQRCKYQ